MDKEILSIIKSFEENKKNLEALIPLIEEYCSNTQDIKKVLEILNDSSIDNQNKELNVSINKISAIQNSMIDSIKDLKNIIAEISKNKIEIEEYKIEVNKRLNDLEENLNDKIDSIESEYKEIINLNKEKKSKMDKYGLN